MAYNLHGSCSYPTSISPPMHDMLASSSLHNQRTQVGPEVEECRIRPLPMKRFQLRRPRSSVFFSLHDHVHPSETATTATIANNNGDDEDGDNNNKDVSDGNSPSKETALIFTGTSPTLSILAASMLSSTTATNNNKNSNAIVTDVCTYNTITSEKSALVFTYNSPTLSSSSSSSVYSSSTTTTNNTNNKNNNLEDVIDCTTSPSKEFALDFTYNSPALSSLSSVSSSSLSSSRFRGEISRELECQPLSIKEKDGDVFDHASNPSPCHNPLDNMDSLRKFLPLKRGLSRHYVGKSQSLTSFDGIETVFDLAKSDYRSLKKSRITMA